MPLDKSIKKTLIIGSGAIVIGQAAEFDYAGVQACRALKEEGIETVLVNSNPATIMTDKNMADKIYIEPLTIPVLKRIIRAERPDSVLSTLGGQTGLTLSMQLAKDGFLDRYNVRLLGSNPETIDKAEDRAMFKATMEEIGQPCIPSKVVTDVQSALDFGEEIGYPLIVRPAFTLGGSGGGIAKTRAELTEIAHNGIQLSPINQVLIEKSVAGWKEIEFEVMRDAGGNAITVCSMENLDPVGVHTGDSIVVAPCQTLADKEYQMLRTAALNIINALKVEGGCNVQFALNPNSFQYAVIEVNPRVSRSSALASKATGYPIAKVAAKVAIGYRLSEIKNQVTGFTSACFEPALDYIVVKMPRFPFDKFVYANRTLNTQMKATGEVMAIDTSFEGAMMKAVMGAEISLDSMNLPKLSELDDAGVEEKLHDCDDERIFVVYEAIKRGISVDRINEITAIDKWFINKLRNLVEVQNQISSGDISDELYMQAKHYGFTDKVITELSGKPAPEHRNAVYKMVDTCAAEFEAQTPYFYSTMDDENEALSFIKEGENKRVLVLGAGPIRIGQGIEFDYCCVQCVWALKKLGYEAVIINNNPETVSTDFDVSTRLYFDPLTPESVMNVINTERPMGVMVAFGGQTAIKLTRYLHKQGVPILGTAPDSIDIAEDRERFEILLDKCDIRKTPGETVFTLEEALKAAKEIGYPVMLRPSYVLGGQNMIIAFSDDDVVEYMKIILTHEIENPVLIDKYLRGIEAEVDVICDGESILIPGIMEHIERAGVHSGDSIAVYPPRTLSPNAIDTIVKYTEKMAMGLNIKGILNIQFVVHEGDVYVIEANPRSSRTVPYISKVTDVPIIELATRIIMGEKLADMEYGTGLYPNANYTAVKVPVFSFEKLHGVDTQLGPEMKSTGEVLGLSHNFTDALYKGLVAAGYKMETEGGVLMTVRDRDKSELPPLAEKFHRLGFKIYATKGTTALLAENGIPAETVAKINENENENTATLIESGKISYVISTSEKGRKPARDSVKIRRKAVERSIPCLTSMDTANALADCMLYGRSIELVELININRI